MFSSCDDSTSIMFTDYYACIKDEGGGATSTISTNMTESYTATYYISLVSVIMDDPVTISYEIKAGHGLKEGVNFKVGRIYIYFNIFCFRKYGNRYGRSMDSTLCFGFRHTLNTVYSAFKFKS